MLFNKITQVYFCITYEFLFRELVSKKCMCHYVSLWLVTVFQLFSLFFFHVVYQLFVRSYKICFITTFIVRIFNEIFLYWYAWYVSWTLYMKKYHSSRREILQCIMACLPISQNTWYNLLKFEKLLLFFNMCNHAFNFIVCF